MDADLQERESVGRVEGNGFHTEITEYTEGRKEAARA